MVDDEKVFMVLCIVSLKKNKGLRRKKEQIILNRIRSLKRMKSKSGS